MIEGAPLMGKQRKAAEAVIEAFEIPGSLTELEGENVTVLTSQTRRFGSYKRASCTGVKLAS